MEDYAYLRPLGVGELIDRAVRLYRQNFLTATWIAAAFSLPVLILVLLLPSGYESVANLLGMPLTVIMTGALVYLFGQTYLSKPAAFKDSASAGTGRFWTIIGANLLQGLAIGLPAALLAACVAMIGGGGVILAVIIVLPIAIFFSARWSVVYCAIMLEGCGSSAGLSRSWNLTKQSIWRVLGISLILTALSWLLNGLPIIFFTFVSEYLGSDLPPRLLSGIGSVIGTFGTLITSPLSMATYVVMFYDLRIRHEGFDLQMRAQPEPDAESPASEETAN